MNWLNQSTLPAFHKQLINDKLHFDCHDRMLTYAYHSRLVAPTCLFLYLSFHPQTPYTSPLSTSQSSQHSRPLRDRFGRPYARFLHHSTWHSHYLPYSLLYSSGSVVVALLLGLPLCKRCPNQTTWVCWLGYCFLMFSHWSAEDLRG